MTTFFRWRHLIASGWITAIAVSVSMLPTAFSQEPPDSFTVRSEPAIQGEAGVETILRGPLHEAFAEPIELDLKPTVVINREPPDVIEEIPPEVRPADNNAEWISGYWAWDEERDDFIWISGIWRVPPPGRRWVPGHWTRVEEGYQWISGFWAGETVEQVTYLPYPPESLEQGPNQPAPSDNHYWVSGQWMYQGGRYAWRTGYWNTYQAGWAWNPAYYVWTPRGAIFVNGYWDYPFANRGVLFAPAYFSQPIYRRSGYYYSPNVALNITRLALNLFVNPGYNHYYWGDYYSSGYAQRGFYPWYQYSSARRGFYDPMLAYYRTSYRLQGIDYDQRMRGWHSYYSRNPNFRPPRTYSEQVRIAARAEGNQNLQYALLGSAVGDLLTSGSGRNQFTRLPIETRQSLGRSSDEFRKMRAQRQRVETASATAANVDTTNAADRAAARAQAQSEARLELPKARARSPEAVTPETPELPAQDQRGEQPDRDTVNRDTVKGRTEDPTSPDAKSDAKSDEKKGATDADKGKGKGRRPDSRRPGTDASRPGGEQKKASPVDPIPVIPEAPATPDQPATDTKKGPVDKAKKNIDPATSDPAPREKSRGQGEDKGNKGNKGKTGKNRTTDGNRNQPSNRSEDPAAKSVDNPVTPPPVTVPAVPAEPMPKSDLPKTDLPKTEQPKVELPGVSEKGATGNADRRPGGNRPPRGQLDPTTPVLPPANIDSVRDKLDAPAPNTSRSTPERGTPEAGRRGNADSSRDLPPPNLGRRPNGEGDASRTTRNRVDPDSVSPPRSKPTVVAPPTTAGETRRGRSSDATVPNPEGRSGASDAARTTRSRVDPDSISPPRSPTGVVPPTAGEERRGRGGNANQPPVGRSDVNPAPRKPAPTESERDRSNRQSVGRSSPSSQDRSPAPPMNRPAPAASRESAPPPSAPPTARSAPPPSPAPSADRGNKSPPPERGNAKSEKRKKDKDDS